MQLIESFRDVNSPSARQAGISAGYPPLYDPFRIGSFEVRQRSERCFKFKYINFPYFSGSSCNSKFKLVRELKSPPLVIEKKKIEICKPGKSHSSGRLFSGEGVRVSGGRGSGVRGFREKIRRRRSRERDEDERPRRQAARPGEKS